VIDSGKNHIPVVPGHFYSLCTTKPDVAESSSAFPKFEDEMTSYTSTATGII